MRRRSEPSRLSRLLNSRKINGFRSVGSYNQAKAALIRFFFISHDFIDMVNKNEDATCRVPRGE